MKILLLDAANQNTLAITRHLGKAGHEVHLVGYQKESLAFYSKYVFRKYFFADPRKDEASYIKSILSLLSEQQFGMIMPVGFKSYQVCSKHRDEIRKFTKLVITSDSSISLAISKQLTYDFAAGAGVSIPATHKVKSVDEIKTLPLTYPVVIKSPFESGKNVVEYADNLEDVISKFNRMCMQEKLSSPDLPLLQEYVEGDGYGFFAIYKEGKCMRYFMHHRIREYPVTGGASVCAESFSDETLMNEGLKMLDALKWEGVAMVEFKKDNKDGRYKLMEINPKLWGSLELAIVSGINFPELLIESAEGKLRWEESLYSKTRFQWLLNGELFHFFERPRNVLGIIGSLFVSKKDFWWSDVRPNLFQVANIFVHYKKKLFRR
jgi:predicted ATP-grasp superfamily ATP-dependent carboligase